MSPSPPPPALPDGDLEASAAPPRTFLASQDSTIGARIGISLATIPLPADPPTPPELADHLVAVVAEDVLGDLLAVGRVDLREVDATLDEGRVVLAQGLGERGRAGGVGGVGVEPTEQGGQRGPGGLLHLGGVRPDLLGELLEVDLRQDLVHC